MCGPNPLTGYNYVEELSKLLEKLAKEEESLVRTPVVCNQIVETHNPSIFSFWQLSSFTGGDGPRTGRGVCLTHWWTMLTSPFGVCNVCLVGQGNSLTHRLWA